MKFLYSALLRSAPEVEGKMLKQDDIVCQRPSPFHPPFHQQRTVTTKKKKKMENDWNCIGWRVESKWIRGWEIAEMLKCLFRIEIRRKMFASQTRWKIKRPYTIYFMAPAAPGWFNCRRYDTKSHFPTPFVLISVPRFLFLNEKKRDAPPLPSSRRRHKYRITVDWLIQHYITEMPSGPRGRYTLYTPGPEFISEQKNIESDADWIVIKRIICIF